jgi:molybdate transport system substrate-binding protein
MRKIAALALVLPVALTALAGCGSSGDNASATQSSGSGQLSGSITVFAASSLTGAFNQIATDFKKAHPGTDIVFQFGSSGDLATSITQGGSADVFASASPTNMQAVLKNGDAASSTDFVSNTAEIATPPGNPKHITGLADLATAKVALCVPTAPCGALAQQLFQKAGVTVKPAASEPDVKTTLAVVQSGEVDAGIVYVTDVKAAGAKVTGVEIPADQNGTTEYPIATLNGSKNKALAAAFVSYIESAAGQKVLTDAGFSAP